MAFKRTQEFNGRLDIKKPAGPAIKVCFLGPLVFTPETCRVITALGAEHVFATPAAAVADADLVIAFLDLTAGENDTPARRSDRLEAIRRTFAALRVAAFFPRLPRIVQPARQQQEEKLFDAVRRWAVPLGAQTGRAAKWQCQVWQKKGIKLGVWAGNSFFDENQNAPRPIHNAYLPDNKINYVDILDGPVAGQDRSDQTPADVMIALWATTLHVHRWNTAEFPLPYMRRIARQFLNNGAALAIGDNALLAQGFEQVRCQKQDRIAVYSLGRLMGDADSASYQWGNYGSILAAQLDRQGVCSLQWHPFCHCAPGHLRRLNVREHFLFRNRVAALSTDHDWPKSITVRRSSAWLDGIRRGKIVLNRPESSRTCSLAAVGDINIRECVLPLIRAGRGNVMFHALARAMQSCQIRFGNMESLLAAAGRPIGVPHHNNVPQALPFLAKAGFNVMSCANNHFLDYGAEGAIGTLANLQARGIRTLGAGKNQAAARKPVIFHAQGLRVGFLGYTDSVNVRERLQGIAIAMTNPFSELLAEVKRLRRRVDFLVVSLHIGPGYTDYPDKGDRKRLTAVVDTGADLIICHGSHVPQGLEIYRQVVLVHGLGNCFFSEERQYYWTTRGYLLKVSFGKRRVERLALIPFRLNADETLALLRGEERQIFLDRLANISGALEL